MKHKDESPDDNANRDPVSGAPGAHPIGTGIGAIAGGAAAGAAVGTVAGPIGTLVGAATGVVVGGLAGKAAAEAIDPTQENQYWQDHYNERPYVAEGSSYDDYGPAFSFGVDAASRHPDRSFEQAEPEMSRQWSEHRGTSTLRWDHARPAAHDAWNRARGSH